MGHSSLVGTNKAPQRPKGTDEEALGPSDITDSGSDMQGTYTLPEADPGEPVDVTLGRDVAVAPIEGTSEESDDMNAADIGVDQVIAPDDDKELRALDADGELPQNGRRHGRHATQS